jgi:hypothetical protein
MSSSALPVVFNDDRNIAAATKVLVGLNVLSLVLYAIEYNKPGEVITASGGRAQGYHKIPAIVAFLAYLYQVGSKNKRDGWHALVIGKIAILTTIAICLGFATKNTPRACARLMYWASEDVMPVMDPMLRKFVLTWNEAVNLHQFNLYGPLLINQLWREGISNYQGEKVQGP